MVIAVDFDGTIVEHLYPKIGNPVPYAIDVLKKLQQEENHTLILWTVREGKYLQDALDYCEKQGLRFYAANKNDPEEEDGSSPRKLTADLFIDDKNIGGLPDWGIIYKMIKSGVTDLNDIDNEYLQDTQSRRKKNFFIRLGEAWDMSKGKRY